MIDQHDAVVDHDADQNDQADLGHHVERRAGQQQEQHDAHSRERQREHDRERVQQRLEQRGHHEIDHEQRQQHAEREFLRVLVLLLGEEAVAPLVSRRVRQLVQHRLDGLASFLDPLSAVDHLNLREGPAVLPHDPAGHAPDAQVGHVAEQHLFARVGSAHHDRLEMLDALHVRRIESHPQFHLALGRAEVPHASRAHCDPQHLGDRAGGDVVLARYVATQAHAHLVARSRYVGVNLRDSFRLEQLRSGPLRELPQHPGFVTVDVGADPVAVAAAFLAEFDPRARDDRQVPVDGFAYLADLVRRDLVRVEVRARPCPVISVGARCGLELEAVAVGVQEGLYRADEVALDLGVVVVLAELVRDAQRGHGIGVGRVVRHHVGQGPNGAP